MLHQAGPGLERVKAVRHALGPETSPLVNCHSRFSVQVAEMISRDLAALGVEWFEEPVHLDSTVDDLTTRV
jgi:L-alanine-DL-glutamate epimerase-like enolase superfamily enzyme